jgi:CHAT domain-containing protein
MGDPHRSWTACRTRRRFRRDNPGRRAVSGWCTIAALFLSAVSSCTREQPPAVLFDSAKNLFHRGEFTAAKREAARGERKFQDQPQSEWFWKFSLLLAEIDLWSGETKEAERLLAQAPPAPYRESRVQYQILRSYSLFRLSRDTEAESALQAAATEAHAIGAWELEADAGLLLGSQLLGHANEDRAEAVLQNGLQIASDHQLKYEEMAALLNLGAMRYGRSLYGDAIPYFERADELAKQLGANAAHRMAIENESSCYRDIGDVERALKTQLEVVSAEERNGLPTTRSNAYIDLGATYLLKQDTWRAIECFRKALSSVKASDVPAEFVVSASSLAQALELTGALEEAERYNEKAFQLCDKQNKEQLAELTLNKATLAERRMRHADAIDCYRKAIELDNGVPSLLWEAHAGLGSVYARTGNLPEAHSHFEQALHVIEENRSQLRRKYQITFLSSLIRFYQQYVSLLMSEGETQKALEVADSSRASVLTQSLAGSIGGQPKNLAAGIRRMAKEAHCVFLFYWLAPERSYLWVISPEEMQAMPLPAEHQITQDVNSYRALLVDEKRDALAGSSALGERLYNTLIAPAEPRLAHGSRVVIVPDGSLHQLNFEMLVSHNPQPHYWIEDVLISVAPSLSILRDRHTRPGTPDRSLLLIGDPEPAPEYPKLPQAAYEIEDIQHHFPPAETSVYRGPKATIDAYRTAPLQNFSTIHFATHAEANEQSPLDSAIILSPMQNGYKLYARDVMELPLTAELVTISACRGAGARTISGEGSVGLAWAFFQAGARSVVTSLWDANDRSTAELMNRFYSGVQSEQPYAIALRQAKLAMLASVYRKPYYWAPFQLYTRIAPR